MRQCEGARVELIVGHVRWRGAREHLQVTIWISCEDEKVWETRLPATKGGERMKGEGVRGSKIKTGR